MAVVNQPSNDFDGSVSRGAGVAAPCRMQIERNASATEVQASSGSRGGGVALGLRFSYAAGL
jgi:hypothetical protein